MCGLFGVIRTNFIGQGDKEAFQKLSFLSSVRGIDSTGFAGIKLFKEGVHSQILKSALDPVSFSKTAEAIRFLGNTGLRALAGHTRYKTRGAATSQNAHPFRSECGNFVLFHNGTLTNSTNKYETDSEWLCNRIADNKGDLGESLKSVWGAWALVLYEEDKRKFSILRNKERPLHYVQQHDGIVYASEPWMLDGIGTGTLEKRTLQPESEVLTVTYNEKGVGVVAIEALHIPKFSYHQHQRHNYWDGGGYEGWSPNTTKSTQGTLPLNERREARKNAHNATGPKVVQKQEKETPKKNRESSSFPRKTYDLSGDIWTYQDFLDIGLTHNQAAVAMCMSEEFEVRIENGYDTMFVQLKNGAITEQFVPFLTYYRRISDGCPNCSDSGTTVAKHEKFWYDAGMGTEFLCDDCKHITQN